MQTERIDCARPTAERHQDACTAEWEHRQGLKERANIKQRCARSVEPRVEAHQNNEEVDITSDTAAATGGFAAARRRDEGVGMRSSVDTRRQLQQMAWVGIRS